MFKKLLILALLIAAVALVITLDLQQYLSIDMLKQQKTTILAFYNNHPISAISLIFIAYILVSIAIPANAILTVTVGMIFGLYQGIFIASIAATVGATCAMLFSRYLIKDALKKKFPALISALNKGFENQGNFYLLSLRLVPIAPYMIVNLAMGLTSIKITHYAVITYAGMFIILMVLVNAGSQLSTIEHIKDITSPALIISLSLLAVIPLVIKYLLGKYQAYRQSN